MHAVFPFSNERDAVECLPTYAMVSSQSRVLTPTNQLDHILCLVRLGVRQGNVGDIKVLRVVRDTPTDASSISPGSHDVDATALVEGSVL